MSSAFQPLGFSLPGKVADLERRAKAALSLTDQVRESLPEEQKTHLLSASYRDDTLSITMDSAAWCPQVRYGAETLLESLKASGGPEFAKLKVRVGRRGA
ncbi:MAG: DciA family protein [Steroidobacteraceae bacterium]